ncbi:MAG: hypothetical protein ACRDBT_02435 [Aeromonas sp.]
MTPFEIESIVNAIAEKGINFPWWSYAISISSLLLVAFINAYLINKAKSFATKEDFKSLLTHLEHETTIKETIKNALSYQTWLKQDKNSILRDRIEILVTNTISLRKVVEQLSNSLGGMNDEQLIINDEFDEIVKIEMICLLYFPSIEVEVIELHLRLREFSLYVQQSRNFAHKAIETNNQNYIADMKMANLNAVHKHQEVVKAIRCVCDKAKLIFMSID